MLSRRALPDNKLSYTLSLIENQYVDSVSMDSLAEHVIPMLVKELDPHSVYIPAAEMQALNEPLEGEFDGIGVVFNMAPDTVIVLNVIPSGPSDKAGVKAFARGGLAMPGWAVVGEEGPELVNFSQPGRVYTAADTAALFRSATPRGTSGESGGSREEVYELRRDMNILLNEVAKYGRRVSDLVELWDKEGMPGVRA